MVAVHFMWGEKYMGESFVPSAHPVLVLPSREQGLAMGAVALAELVAERERVIARERWDPFRFGFYLDCWKDADALLREVMLLAVFGGNGSAKTVYMCRKGIETMIEHPGSKVLWLHEAEKPSVLVHQAMVWHWLPRELKEEAMSNRRRMVTKIRYTVATGFSDGKFVLPNGSIGVFGSYKQDIGDYEGTGWKMICADENMPLGWLKTLTFRLPRCEGKMIWGFTPIRGITPAVKHLMNGAATEQTIEVDASLMERDRVHVEGCPAGTMPYVQRAIWPDTRIIYFQPSKNPFGGYEDFRKLLVGRPRKEIEQRCYGYARNNVGSCFPKFSAVHVLKRGRVAEMMAGSVTRRHYADPAGARNMFQIWAATDGEGRKFIYREWPDVPTFGEWATTAEDSRKWDGDAGPAQPSLGFGVVDYKRIILEAEGNKFEDGAWKYDGEAVFERRFDPRSGKAGAMTEEHGGVSLMDMFLEDQWDDGGRLVGPSLNFDQAPGLSEDQGVMVINDLLSWNEQERLCAVLNEPKLYVSEDCQNLIWALQTYTRNDGEKAACKDPIDCLRYFVTDDSVHIADGSMLVRGGGAY